MKSVCGARAVAESTVTNALVRPRTHAEKWVVALLPDAEEKVVNVHCRGVSIIVKRLARLISSWCPWTTNWPYSRLKSGR